jgi:iron complex transport system permease protein
MQGGFLLAVDSLAKPEAVLAKPAGPALVLPSWRRRVWSMAGLGVLLIFVILGATAAGSAGISPAELGQAWLDRLTGTGTVSAAGIIVMDIRLPRALLAALVGAALAVAGVAYQGLFRNPLADPYLIGVMQGGALGATVGFLIPGLALAVGIWSIPLLAFAGGTAAVAVVYLLARTGKAVPVTTLILAGVALGAFLAAITSYLWVRSGDQLHGIIAWLLGRFSVGSWDQVAVVAPYALAGIAVVYLYARPLNVLQLDDEQARQLGVEVEKVKLILLGAATLATAAAVAFCGIIGFVGIIVPHFVRLVWGPDHRFLVPLSALCGAVFLVVADTLARTVLAPVEVPVGVVTALAGAPFFLWLLRRQKRMVF